MHIHLQVFNILIAGVVQTKNEKKKQHLIVYIGETNRHIITRVEEHKDCFSEKYPTAIGRHIQDCEACLGALRSGNLSYKNFEIISRCRSKLDCEVKEAVSITKLQPPLNKQLFQSGQAVTLKIFG